MKITNIRILNNYKVKLVNAKLSGVNQVSGTVAEQGTRTPSIPTTPTTNTQITFQQKFDLVLKYLIDRYEPTWSVGSTAAGKLATMSLLGISDGINPLIAGGTVESAFNYVTNGDDGWFDPLTHPKDFASAVRTAYKQLQRARTPQKANHRFVNYGLVSILSQDYLYNGGNAFFGFHPDYEWYPGTSMPNQLYHGYEPNYRNGIHRYVLHSPYGNFSSPMNSLAGNWRRFPWLSDRYTAESFQFDMHLLSRQNTTPRDLLSDPGIVRDGNLGVVVAGITDTNLNTLYRSITFPAGTLSKISFNDYGRTGGGYGSNEAIVGSPWIRFPEAITYSNWWGQASELSGLCFDYGTLVLFDGQTFPSQPQSFASLSKSPMSDSIGICFAYGDRLLQSLNSLSDTWGNSMEFIAYLGCIPYGTGFEMRIPFALYKDPTIEENVRYFKWRLDASVSHWKEKFKSPIDGFAHVFMDASALIERTYHQWQAPGYTLWTNITPSGLSYVENIPVSWARDQHNYTYGSSGPDSEKAVVFGTETFAQYMFRDDVSYYNPNRNDQRRFNGDTEPRHWCLDDDKATALFSTLYDITLGQRKWGLTYADSIWGMGVCGSSTLGEVFAVSTREALWDVNKVPVSGLPFLYNTFTKVNPQNADIKWKDVPGTFGSGVSGGVPWHQDRRFTLFYLYPTALALNLTLVDHFHDGIGYYRLSNWFDKDLGLIFLNNDQMVAGGLGKVVSDFPHVGRKIPSKPPQNYWTGNARTSEFELLYACMKGGVTGGLDSLGFTNLYNELYAAGYGQNTNGFRFMIDGIFDTGDSALNQYYRNRFISEGCIFYDIVYENATTNSGIPIRDLIPGNSTINRNALVTYIQEKFGIQPNSQVERHVVLDFEFDFDSSLLYGVAYNGATVLSTDSVLNGDNNTRVTDEITRAINQCKDVFGSKVKFTHWGHPVAANYLVLGQVAGGVDSVDYLNATSQNREARIQHSVSQHSPVMSVYDFALPYAYDAYPNQDSIDSGLAIKSPADTPNYPYNQNSAGDDHRRTASTEITRRINIRNGNQSMPVYPNISWWYDPNQYYAGMMGVMVPTSEMLSYYTSLKASYPLINGISFWTASDYFFNSLAFGIDTADPEQQRIRDSLVRNYLNGVNPVPNQYPNWRHPDLKKYLMTKANDDLLSLIAQMKVI